MKSYPRRHRAAQMLLLATLCWGLSFPVMKALGLVQQQMVGQASTWFITAWAVAVRFSAAALIMWIWSWRTFRSLTWSEAWQGLGLGLFGGAGLIFQMDGLAYTSASTSAFLTQAYSLVLPLVIALRDRRWPSRMLMFCCFLLLAGVAVLAGVDWRAVRLGRGEAETLLGSLLFAGQ